jgi:hypothetical protein
MNVTLRLNPEVERGLLEQAHARGVSLDNYLLELVAREPGLAKDVGRPIHERFDNLSDLLLNSPFAGANLDLERSKDYPRSLDTLWFSMSGFLVDTNVLSEYNRPGGPDAGVKRWLETTNRQAQYVSVITLAEIKKALNCSAKARGAPSL